MWGQGEESDDNQEKRGIGDAAHWVMLDVETLECPWIEPGDPASKVRDPKTTVAGKGKSSDGVVKRRPLRYLSVCMEDGGVAVEG